VPFRHRGECKHAWTLRYSVNGKQLEKSFRDSLRSGRTVYGSGRKLAQDFQLKLTVEGGAVLRVSWQASQDGRQRLPLKHRRAGDYRDVPVPSRLWERVRDLPAGPVVPGTPGRCFSSM
jgi:hypothetical protein